ncbi:MAG: Lrp/AsnC family transcriptional regulator [Rhizobiaceae bacterium]
MQYSLTLDGYDIKLLAALQENATLTNQQLADAVNLSPSQCSRRRASLEQRKLIIACEARLDREQLGYGLTVFVSVMLNTHNRDNARKFAELMKRLPMVLEAHSLTGEMDYQIKLVARNLRELSDIINNEILPHESVQTVKTSIVLDTIKETSSIPLSA